MLQAHHEHIREILFDNCDFIVDVDDCVDDCINELTNLQKYNKLETHLTTLESLLSETEKTLSALYSQNIIHPKYCNITAISSILDYIDTGITNSLTRNDSDPGAYYLYEEDVRANRVIDVITIGFNQISSQLSAIQRNQYSLHSAIQNSNSILTGISNELHAISGQIERNTSAIHQGNITLSNLQNIAAANTQEQSAGNARLDEIPYFTREMKNCARTLVDINRDRWGILRNRDGFPI